MYPPRQLTNSDITLLIKRLAPLIRPGLASLHRRRSVTCENNSFMDGYRLWRSCRSCFIAVTKSTLFTFPRSLLPQQMSRTAGADRPRSKCKSQGTRPLQRSPPRPNHWMWAAIPKF
uniref:Uncharacterized protein n=1 Tax=Knipowitschia caucasica TaxID=637954 RepID=A0AAV2KHM6_KNICA